MQPTVHTTRHYDSYSARLLRALCSALIPGVGQLIAGARRRGFVLLGIFVAATLFGVVVLSRGTDAVLSYLVQPKVLLALFCVNIVILLVRIFAVVDAWRTPKVGTGRSKRSSRAGTATAAAVLALILVLTVAPHAMAGYYTIVSQNLLTSVFSGHTGNSSTSTIKAPVTGSSAVNPTNPTETSTVTSAASSTSGTTTTSAATTTSASTTTTLPVNIGGDQRITLLLIGTDAGYGRTGARADSINVATLDMTTGRVALFGIPRNSIDVPLGPKTAKALKESTFPGLINALYAAGAKHPEIASDGDDAGAEAIRESAQLMLGIPIDYYVVVNMLGLADLVDAFGGVDINLKSALHVTYAPLGPGQGKTSYTFHVGVNHLNGLQALAFARDRSDSSDFTRMGRQRCILLGLLYQNSASGLLLKFPKIAAAIEKSVETNIPIDALPQLIRMRSKIKTDKMIALGFIPPDWARRQNSLGDNVMNIPLVKQAVQAILTNPDRWLNEHPASVTSGSSECYTVGK